MDGSISVRACLPVWHPGVALCLLFPILPSTIALCCWEQQHYFYSFMCSQHVHNDLQSQKWIGASCVKNAYMTHA